MACENLKGLLNNCAQTNNNCAQVYLTTLINLVNDLNDGSQIFLGITFINCVKILTKSDIKWQSNLGNCDIQSGINYSVLNKTKWNE